ncbi:MAG: hypothetical protein ABR971_04845 [Acidobacteriaceae bacterium]
MPEIRGLATHAAGAQLLPYKYSVGELGPHEVKSRSPIAGCAIRMFT